jgi:hypothetical protein
MFKIAPSAFAASILALGLNSGPAHAQRVFVAAQGDDANPVRSHSRAEPFSTPMTWWQPTAKSMFR